MPDTSALDVRTDAEVHFNGRATLENGLKIHTRWELEGGSAHSNSDIIDEYFLSISGSFGQIVLGGTENASVRMLTGSSGSWTTGVGRLQAFYSHEWVPSAAGARFGTIQHVRLSGPGGGDSEKATYISTNFGGFQIGASYTPNNTESSDGRVDAGTDQHDSLAGAFGYSGKFNDVGIAGGAGVLATQGCNDGGACGENVNAWFAGGRLDFGSARISVAYKQTEQDGPTAGAPSLNGYVVDAGVRYLAGANQFSVTGSYGQMDDTQARYQAVVASYARTMGPGVKIFTTMVFNDSESDDGLSKNSGIAAMTGIHVGF